jgi:hypothetical protein
MFHVEHFKGGSSWRWPNCSTWNISKQIEGLFRVEPASVKYARIWGNSLQRTQGSGAEDQKSAGRDWAVVGNALSELHGLWKSWGEELIATK